MSGPITCPQCGARNPPTATWCSLCHARFEPATQQLPKQPTAEQRSAAAERVPEPAPGRGETADHPRGAPLDPAAGADPNAWAALLAAEEGRRQSSFEQAMARRGTKVLFVVGAIAAVLVVTALIVAVLTGIGD